MFGVGKNRLGGHALPSHQIARLVVLDMSSFKNVWSPYGVLIYNIMLESLDMVDTVQVFHLNQLLTGCSQGLVWVRESQGKFETWRNMKVLELSGTFGNSRRKQLILQKLS